MGYEFQNMEELNNNIESTNQDVSQEILDGTKEMRAMTGGQVGAIVYGIQRISDIPAVNDKIQDCKEGFNNAMENAKDTISEFGTKISENIKDYCCGVYEDIKDFFTHSDKENLSAYQFPEAAKLNEGITEGREFGIAECTEAALEIFNEGVIDGWANLSIEDRVNIATLYAEKVATAFELENYKGVIIEDMEPGTFGSNNGDGTIHLASDIFSDYTSPMQVVDTITHELRHQYQSECVNGFHDVTNEVRNEWSAATAIYNYDWPSSYDPWGYNYNPLEIDSNYAANTVVRNISSQYINNIVNPIA